jgi:hypothetical protein
MKIPEKQLQIETVKDVDVYFSSSPIAERFTTKEGDLLSVYPLREQSWLRDKDHPLIKAIAVAETVSDSTDLYLPIHLGYIELSHTLLERVDEILSTDTTKPHKMIGLKAKLAMLADIETVFYGSRVVGPEILLP